MTERPILFSGPMVSALLDGRKTQTRRVVKHRGETPPIWATHAHELKCRNVLGHWRPWGIFGWSEEKNDENATLPLRRWPTDPEHPSSWNAIRCPYGVRGDRLWVKETWRPSESMQPWDLDITYAVDGVVRTIKDGEFGEKDWTMPKAAARGNVSPLFMPRWASRLTLAITDIRVERLQDISEAAALAEGISIQAPPDKDGGRHFGVNGLQIDEKTPARAFRALWSGINGPDSWGANPWVWVVTFEVEP